MIASKSRSRLLTPLSRQSADKFASTCVLVSICLFLTVLSAAASEASKHLEACKLHERNGARNEALAEVNKALSIKREYPEALIARGWLLCQLNKPALALRDFSLAVEVNPKSYEGYVSKGYALRMLKKTDEARAETHKAIKLNPKRPEAPYIHGLTCLVDGYSSQAVKFLSMSLANGAAQPLIGHVYYWRGRGNELTGNYQLAVADYSQSIKYEDQLKAKGLGRNYGPFSDARILTGDDKNRPSLGILERGLSYSKIGEYEKSIEDLSSVLKADPSENLVGEERGNAYLKVGKYRLALQDFNRSILKGSPSSKLYLYLAITHYCLGAYDKTLNDLDAWLGRTFWNDDQTVFAVYLKYSTLGKLNKEPEARALIDTALTKLKKDKAWPYPALELAAGKITSDKCLALFAKSGKKQQTQAHLFVALSAQVSGNANLARENFGWVVKNGDRTTDEYTVARAEMASK